MAQRHNKLNVLPQQRKIVYKGVSSAAPPNSWENSNVSSGFFPSKQFALPSIADFPLPSIVPVAKSTPDAAIGFESSFLETDTLPTLKSADSLEHNTFVSNLERAETFRSMVDACKELGIRDLSFDEELGRANGTFFASDHAAIDFHLTLYSAEEDGSTCISAQIISGSGCRIAFSRFKSEIVKILKNRGVVYKTKISPSVWDPRVCPALPLGGKSESEQDDLERLRMRVNACLADCESGYARTIGEDAPQLARFAEDLKARSLLKAIPDVLERLIKLMEPSFETVLVRSVLVCLINLCDGDEETVRQCSGKHRMYEHLMNLRERWSRTQHPFGQDFPHFVVESSREIMFQVDRAISKLS